MFSHPNILVFKGIQCYGQFQATHYVNFDSLMRETKIFRKTVDTVLYLSGEGSSLMARNTGHKKKLDDEYRGAPSVLKIKLMFV